MTATAVATKTRKPSKLFEVTGDNAGNVTLSLSKPASFTLAKCRDLCRGLQKAAPTVATNAKGIADAIEALMSNIAHGSSEGEDDAA